MAPSLASTATILLVEDDDALCELLETALRRQRYCVLTALTESEAEGHMRSQHDKKIDLVIADIHLSRSLQRKEGYEFYKRWRKVSVSPAFLFMSGYAQPAQLPAVHQGEVPFVEKPFEIDCFLEIVDTLLQQNRAKTPGFTKC